MGSQLKVDTITGVSTAGSVAVTGEGNSTTTNLQQGLGKSWANINQNSSTSIRDSFNTSGIVDEATGRHTISFTTSMGNINYSYGGLISAGGCYMFYDSKATGSVKLTTRDATGSAGEYDYDDCGVTFHGDLA